MAMNQYPNLAYTMEMMGAAYRLDWSDVDGRTIRDEMNGLAQVLHRGYDLSEEEMDVWIEGFGFEKVEDDNWVWAW